MYMVPLVSENNEIRSPGVSEFHVEMRKQSLRNAVSHKKLFTSKS